MGCTASTHAVAPFKHEKADMTYTNVRFDDIKGDFAPLDVLFFKGSSAFAHAVRAGERLKMDDVEWSHVGIIVTTDVLPIKNGVPGNLYVWEAQKASPDIPNFETGSTDFCGVQVRELSVVVPGYLAGHGYKIAWSRLKDNPCRAGEDRIAPMRARLAEVYKACNGLPYDRNMVDLAAWLSERLAKLTEDHAHPDRHVFCSEFVTIVYQSIGFLPRFDPRRMPPQLLLQPSNPAGVVIFEEPIPFIP